MSTQNIYVAHVSDVVRSENTHSEVYSKIVTELVVDINAREGVFRAVERWPVLRAKADWTMHWLNDPEVTLSRRLIVFAAAQGIFGASSMAAILLLRERGQMPGLVFAHERILRDIQSHTSFACLLYKHISQPALPPREVFAILAEAINLEFQFFCGTFPFYVVSPPC